MATHIADKSALVHFDKPTIAARFEPLLRSQRVATCGVIELEVLFSSRSESDLVATRQRRARVFPRVATEEADFVRAEEVMGLLAKTGRHRAVSLPDLLIAAVAERAGLVVLHYDADFDIVASATGQKVEWVAPKGSL